MTDELSTTNHEALRIDRTFLHSIILTDKSEPYEYGEYRSYDGMIPEKGAKWLTPREIAQERLRKIEKVLFG